jgi:hypothetical protein
MAAFHILLLDLLQISIFYLRSITAFDLSFLIN